MTRPTYLKLLNAISVAEGHAGRYFDAWAMVTPDEELRALLHFVAVREKEHALSFEKRIIELGYTVKPRPSEEAEGKHRLLSDPSIADAEKLDSLGYGADAPAEDVFDGFFRDHSIDIETGALLGRYIAEERDTGRRLRDARRRLRG